MRKVTVLIIMIIIMSWTVTIAAPNIPIQESFDERIGKIVAELSLLEKKGGNVTGLVMEVNRALKLAERGDYDGANRILDRVEVEIESLKPAVEHQYKLNTVKKYASIVFLLALPLVTYYSLPRIYLAIWYRARRNWIVEE